MCCFKCGKPVHKASECHSKSGNGQRSATPYRTKTQVGKEPQAAWTTSTPAPAEVPEWTWKQQ